MTPDDDWRPTAARRVLERRAGVLASIRDFFARRGVLEVDTPVIGRHTVTDAQIESVSVADPLGFGRAFYLQTSPEFAMKRLLASGSGPIYQIAHAFRHGERGRLHNPEFTLVEWYRPGFDHHALMGEVAELVGGILDVPRVRYTAYADAFQRILGVDPFDVSVSGLRQCAARFINDAPDLGDDRDAWLDLLMGEVVGPGLGGDGLEFVYDYPASQAALARLCPDDRSRAARFELFVSGWELANGFHELTDADEQRRRFRRDQQRRAACAAAVPEADERLLAALSAGLPDCAGVALGLERLLMLLTGASRIDEVVCFPLERS